MPALALPIALAVGGGAAAGASIYGAKKQASGADRAADLQYKASQDAIALERERDAQARAQWEARESLLAPYRAISSGLANQYARYYGLPTAGASLTSMAAPRRDVLTPQARLTPPGGPTTLSQIARRPQL